MRSSARPIAIAGTAMFLALLVACFGEDPRDAVFPEYVPGATFVGDGPGDEWIAYDSGAYRHSPVRVTLLGYSEPRGRLIAGERLVVLSRGDVAVYLFLDAEDRVVRREAVGS